MVFLFLFWLFAVASCDACDVLILFLCAFMSTGGVGAFINCYGRISSCLPVFTTY